jgi:chromosome partitioning protein
MLEAGIPRNSRSAMVLADSLYSPAKASQFDLWTIHLARLIDLARAINHRLDARVLITMAPTNPRINEERDAMEMLREFGDRLAVSHHVTRERKAYRDAMRDGKGVVELADAKAGSEIDAIAQEIYGDEIQTKTDAAGIA